MSAPARTRPATRPERMGARRLRRARAALAGACCLAGALLVVELPLGQLVQQHSQLASVDRQLAAVSRANAHLRGAIAALRQPATVGAIAHQEYGLIQRGQKAYAILPSAGSGASLVARTTVPRADLVPTSVSPYPTANGPAPALTGGLWRRVVDRLAFWRWAF